MTSQQPIPTPAGRLLDARPDAPLDESDAHRRIRQSFLASQRGELLAPVCATIDICERLLSDPGHAFPEEFVSDLQLMQTAGHDLSLLIDEILSPTGLEAAAANGELDRVRSRMRHDMLNKLNPIVNYSEMWLEEAVSPPLAAAASDLELLHKLGKECIVTIDRILDSWDVDTVDLADFNIGLVTSAVDRMFGRQPRDAAACVIGHVLVVDDNQINRDILRRRLESYGHRVSSANDGMQALERLGREEFDLVLLDIVMPEMDGFDVLLRMKGDRRLKGIPVIMISALGEMDIVVRCIEAGAEDYLPKPFNPVLLKARIDACLEKKRLYEREVEHLQRIEQERRRADELLHVILPSEIVTELKSTNVVVPRRYENVAVLFADLVNFTSYCDRNPAEEVVQRLQDLVIEWEAAALRHQVEKIKTIGDSFMAVSGLLKSAENPVLNCVRCGLEMIAATQSLVTDWDLRVGVHFGPVVAGVLGQRQYQFDLWGDTVNTAARIESHGVPGAITLSRQAWRHVEGLGRGDSLGTVPVKGKGLLEIIRFDCFVQAATVKLDELDWNMHGE
jgi:class 3 adenylate cyclase